MNANAFVSPDEFKSLAELFQVRVRLTPGSIAYRQFDCASDRWTSYSWADVAARVEGFIRALAKEGLASGARIGVLVPNGIDHVCIDQAALAMGFVPVPMHVIDNPESLAYVLGDSGASLLFVGSAARWNVLEPYRARFPSLKRVVTLGQTGETVDDGVARPLGRWLGEPDIQLPVADGRASVTGDSLAALVYTSGTTGRAKGVMLSHRNILANVRAIMAAVPVLDEDVFLSFLPLSHTLERTAGYYLPMAAGATVVFARSVSRLMEDFGTIRPTVLVSVPRIYERAYARITESVNRSLMARCLFAVTVAMGWRRFEHLQGRSRPPSLLARCVWPLLDRSVASRVRQLFGGRLRAAVTGGAPMIPEVARPFLASGVPILQGYGMTESAPVVACNAPDANDPESVGRPLPGVQVKLGDQEELLVHGDNVMVGYWQRSEDTARAIDPDGWLHTGDRAQLKEGRIYIKGRLKDIIVTSTGEKISPSDLEAAIQTDPVFDQAMVLGEGRPYIAALLVLNRAQWMQQARRLGLDPEEGVALQSKAAQDWAAEHVRSAVRAFPSYATPRAVILSTEAWTVASGLITPTLKPKRKAIEAHFALEIAALYEGHALALRA